MFGWPDLTIVSHRSDDVAISSHVKEEETEALTGYVACARLFP